MPDNILPKRIRILGTPYSFCKCKWSRSVMSNSATPWTEAYQAPLSMGFSRQQYWSRLPFPSPADLPDPGIEPTSPALQVDSLLSEPPGKPLETMTAGKSAASDILAVHPGASVGSFTVNVLFLKQTCLPCVPRAASHLVLLEPLPSLLLHGSPPPFLLQPLLF